MYGYSWTPSLEDAQWFAHRAWACYGLRIAGVYRIVETEDDVLAYIDDGQQEEFIIHPGNVRKPQLVRTSENGIWTATTPPLKRRRTSTDCQTAVGNELSDNSEKKSMITKPNQTGMPHNVTCTACGKRPGPIQMRSYTESDLFLCADCALQLSRKILEDLCELLTRGGRRG